VANWTTLLDILRRLGLARGGRGGGREETESPASSPTTFNSVCRLKFKCSRSRLFPSFYLRSTSLFSKTLPPALPSTVQAPSPVLDASVLHQSSPHLTGTHFACSDLTLLAFETLPRLFAPTQVYCLMI
jgi:hypothetical protein